MNEPIHFRSAFIPSPADLDLLPNEIHIWSLDVQRPATVVAKMRGLLAAQECQRADRFRFDKHRRRHIVRSGVLRLLLSGYTGQSPQGIRFCHGPKGKPSLAPGSARPQLHFNLSHSEELAVYAFTLAGPTGIDVEFLRPMPDAASIAERFFSAREHEELIQLPDSLVREGFFNCWTRKEAYLKATGDGLSKPLDQFDVTLIPGQPARMLLLDGDAQEAARWSYHHFVPAPEYIGALAIFGKGFRIEAREARL
ncbi:MAG: 4'-phosphopantetheinyl transferase superfamily protein [Acidobacteriota bacterium]